MEVLVKLSRLPTAAPSSPPVSSEAADSDTPGGLSSSSASYFLMGGEDFGLVVHADGRLSLHNNANSGAVTPKLICQQEEEEDEERCVCM